MKRVTARDFAAIERATAVASSGVLELLREEELKVLNELVMVWNSGRLDDRAASIGVAVIARIRRISNNLQRAVTKGTDVGEQLTSR